MAGEIIDREVRCQPAWLSVRRWTDRLATAPPRRAFAGAASHLAASRADSRPVARRPADPLVLNRFRLTGVSAVRGDLTTSLQHDGRALIHALISRAPLPDRSSVLADCRWRTTAPSWFELVFLCSHQIFTALIRAHGIHIESPRQLSHGIAAMNPVPGLSVGPRPARASARPRVRSALGSGGMGEVYRSRHAPRSRRGHQGSACAVRHGTRSAAPVRRGGACDQPQPELVSGQIYDIGPGYLVLEYIDGTPLQGPLAPAEAVRLGLQIVSALEAAHQRRILHRDLKPANILVPDRQSSSCLISASPS